MRLTPTLNLYCEKILIKIVDGCKIKNPNQIAELYRDSNNKDYDRAINYLFEKEQLGRDKDGFLFMRDESKLTHYKNSLYFLRKLGYCEEKIVEMMKIKSDKSMRESAKEFGKISFNNPDILLEQLNTPFGDLQFNTLLMARIKANRLKDSIGEFEKEKLFDILFEDRLKNLGVTKFKELIKSKLK